MSRDFYELCYDQYKQEMQDADAIYQRAGVMLIVLPLLGTATLALGRIDILRLCFTRVDAFLYYFGSLVAMLGIASSAVFLFLCVYPRKYQTLASMKTWHKWREDYQQYLNKGGEAGASSDGDEPEAATMKHLCEKLVDAQPINAEINEKRRKAFKYSVLAAAIAFAAIGLQAFFYLILKIQGM